MTLLQGAEGQNLRKLIDKAAQELHGIDIQVTGLQHNL
jgi:hypothetical protein